MKSQLTLNLSLGSHGGRRPGSGRKRIHSKGVSHKNRETIKSCSPLHINFKYRTHLRYEQFLGIFDGAVKNAQAKGLGIIHYSIQSNHIHIICEVTNNKILYQSMRSLTTTIVKRLQLQKHLKGSLQMERYHLHVLKSYRETENAIRYVLLNELHHAGKLNKKYTSINKLIDKPRSWLGRKAISSFADIASAT